MKNYQLNDDGSVTLSEIKTIKNITWIDYAKNKGKVSVLQIIILILFLFTILGQGLFPILGWGLFVLSWCCIRIMRGYWPFWGILAIENTDNPIKIYCDKNGNLGLYTRKHRITSAKYDSVQCLPTIDYPTFIMGSNGEYCVYNYAQGKIYFKGSNSIKYIGDNAVLVERDGKTLKYSLIGMCLD